MIKNSRVFSGLTIFFWLTLIIELIILELTNVNVLAILIPLIISTVGTLAMLTSFIVSYRKSRPKVKSLKNEYLESLKPKQPLRFCASDDELLKAYKSSANEISNKQAINNLEVSKEIISKPEKDKEEEFSM